jgi:hypothetical protein
MSRRGVIWLITLPLAIVGSQLGHALAYRLVAPDETRRAHELSAAAHAYLEYAPGVLGVCAVLVLVALGGELVRLASDRRHRSSRLSPLSFALLAPAIFLCQEHLERLFQTGVFPWSALLEPPLLVGLLLQLPCALATYVLARVLLRVVRSLGGLPSGATGHRARALTAFAPPRSVRSPRIRVLALGYGSRGPPLLPV